jgi:hypothetical protein
MLNTGERIRLARWSIPRLGSVGRKLMPKPSSSLYASAVLIWLPRGELPDARGFDAIKVQPPPTPNPHPWWLLHEAVTYAVTCRTSTARCRGLDRRANTDAQANYGALPYDGRCEHVR